MKKRLFIAIPISDEQKTFFSSFKNKIKIENAKISWVKRENLHITVLFLGDIEEGFIPEMVNKIERVAKTTKSFVLRFDQVIWFPSQYSPKMIWGKFCKSEEYELFVKSLVAALKTFTEGGLEESLKELIPHATIARIKNSRDIKTDELKQGIVKDLSVVTCQLIESELSTDGPSYSILKEFNF